jgi:hypothetical protein
MRSSSIGLHSLLAATALIAFVASALAQPSTNGPTGNGPEGAPPFIVFGSGVNMPGTTSGGAYSSPIVPGPVLHRHTTVHRHYHYMQPPQ